MTQLKAAVDNIASLNRPWYNVTLSGGEPTIHPHIFDLIFMLHKTLGERLNNILIITNGSRNGDLYKKIAGIAKAINLRMNISIHTDHVDMNHISELIENLSNDVHINFAIMFNPAKREKVHSIYKTMFERRKKFPFAMKVVPLRDGDRVDPRYTQEDLTWQQETVKQFDSLVKDLAPKFPPPKKTKHSFQIFHDIEYNGERGIVETKDRTANFTNGLLAFKGMFCVAHTALLCIGETGLCQGMVCAADPCICNIYEEGSLKAVRDNLIHAVQCPKDLCGCSSNDPIPKFSSPEETLRFMQVVHAKQAALFDAAH